METGQNTWGITKHSQLTLVGGEKVYRALAWVGGEKVYQALAYVTAASFNNWSVLKSASCSHMKQRQEHFKGLALSPGYGPREEVFLWKGRGRTSNDFPEVPHTGGAASGGCHLKLHPDNRERIHNGCWQTVTNFHSLGTSFPSPLDQKWASDTLPSSHFPAEAPSLHLKLSSYQTSHLGETQEYSTTVRCGEEMVPVSCMHDASSTWPEICPGGQQVFPGTQERLGPQFANPFSVGGDTKSPSSQEWF